MNYILEYPTSALLYILVVVIITIFSTVASRYNNGRLSSFLLLIIISFLSIFSGIRGSSVGVDTFQYTRHILGWQNGLYNAFPTEPGLRIISVLSSFLIPGSVFTLTVVSLVINSAIILRLWSLREKLSFGFAVFIYTATYYIMTFSGIRQWLAIVIIFYASKYIFEMKYVKFSLFVLGASFFHNTAVIAIAIPLFDIIFSKLKYRPQRKMLVLIIFLAPIILIVGIFLEYKINFITQYSYYIDNSKWNGSTGLIIWIRILIGLFIYFSYKVKDFDNPDFYKRVFRIYFVGLLITVPGYYVSNLSRVGLYFSVFEIILFGLIPKKCKRTKPLMFVIIISAFTLSMFLIELAGSGRGHMPYIPFWL